MRDKLKPCAPLRTDYGPWLRTKTLVFKHGASLQTVEYGDGADDQVATLRAQLAEAVALIKDRLSSDTEKVRNKQRAFLARVKGV